MRTLLIIALLASITSSFCQSEFIREDKLWSRVRYGSTFGYPFTTHYYKMTGDTVLNEIQYTKLFESQYEDMHHWDLEGFIRETDTGTVFYLDKLDEGETLLYDFGWQVGERIQSIVHNDTYFYLDSIKTLPFGIYQEPRKHFYISFGGRHLEDIWIEGIGSRRGVLSGLEFNLMVGEYRELLCFSEHDSLKFMLDKYNTCYYNTVSVEDHSIPDVKVVYKSNFLEISLTQEGQEELQFRLFDLNGRELISFQLISAGEFSFDVSNLSGGIYIYQILAPGYSVSDRLLIH